MTLLDGLFGPQAQVRLVGIGGELVPALNRVRAELGRDAVRSGWLRRWRRDQRTEQGEQLFRQIQGFRQELRARALSGAGVLGFLAPSTPHGHDHENPGHQSGYDGYGGGSDSGNGFGGFGI